MDNFRSDCDGRFVVLHHQRPQSLFLESDENVDASPVILDEHDVDVPPMHVHGGPGTVTMFKTLRMATKAARDRYTWIKKSKVTKAPAGVVLLFDASLLPTVATDDEVFEVPGLADKLSEEEFCERQVQAWARRAEAARRSRRG